MFDHALQWEGRDSQTLKLSQWNPFSHEPSSWFDPDWMFGIKEGFNIVIANPPYKILTRNNTNHIELNVYMNDYNSIKKCNSKNLYTIFIESGTRFISTKGNLTFIVPEGLFTTRSYKDCIIEINKVGSVIKIVRFSKFVFENAVTGNLIFTLLKGKRTATDKLYFDTDYNILPIEEDEDPVVNKILANDTIPLKSICSIFKGMVVKDREDVVFESKSKGKNLFLLGKSISKWIISRKYYTDYNMLEIIGGTKKIEKHNIFPRILIRRTGDTLCCAFLNEPALTESTLYSCWSLNSKITNEYILALLNAKLLDYYLKKIMITNKQAFPQVLMTDLENLPLKIANNNKYEKFANLSRRILNITTCDDYSNNKSKQDQVKELEAQIDQMVYKLYDLTPEEIAIVEGK